MFPQAPPMRLSLLVICAFLALCILITPSALAGPPLQELLKDFKNHPGMDPEEYKRIESLITEAGKDFIERLPGNIREITNCLDSMLCWDSNKKEAEALMSQGVSLNYPGLSGPPWDPCRFHSLTDETCHAFDFYFEAERIFIIDRHNQKSDVKCKYSASRAGKKMRGIGILTYKDISKEFRFSGTVSRDFVTFPYCAETGDSITQCSKLPDGPITLLIDYKKGTPTVANISGPDPASCAGGGITPAFFTDYDIQISPAEVKEGIRNGKMVDHYLITERKEPNFYLLDKQLGFLSIKFR
jgi:hypothetical protein